MNEQGKKDCINGYENSNPYEPFTDNWTQYNISYNETFCTMTENMTQDEYCRYEARDKREPMLWEVL